MSPAPAYPPAARAADSAPVSAQSAPAPAMALRPEEDEQARASRLRGGCFPLPVRRPVSCERACAVLTMYAGRRHVLDHPVLYLRHDRVRTVPPHAELYLDRRMSAVQI